MFVNNKKKILILARSLSTFGNVLFDLFIVWTVYQMNENIMNAVYIIGGSMLFRAFISIFTGIMSDRFDRKKLSILCEVGCGISIMFVFLLINNTNSSFLFYFALVIINDVFQTFLNNSFITWTSDLFDEKEYIKFQSTLSIINRIIVIGGSAVAGTLLNIFSSTEVVFINTITFFISAILMFLIPNINQDLKSLKSGKIEINLKHITKFIKTNIVNRPLIIYFILILFMLNLSYGYIPHILPIKIASINMNNPTLIGLIKSFCALGEIVGLMFATKYSEKFKFLFITGLFGSLISMSMIYIFSEIVLLIYVTFFIYGFFDSLTQPYFSFIVKSIDSDKRGRILSIIDTMVLISPSIGMWIGTKLGEYSFGYTIIFLNMVFTISILLFSVLQIRNRNRVASTEMNNA